MSYPPRPPMGMPPMQPPAMMPQYGYMGMMPPMGMGMMPMMPPPPMSTSTSAPRKKLIPQEIPKSGSDEKAPVTTVFVGNISERAPDSMIRTMLQRCGNVLSWKRIQGASGKLQAFGFCEYEQPEATLRCMRLLNDWLIADKKLVVKVDAKTKNLLDDYKKKKKKEAGGGDKTEEKEEGEEDDDDEEDEVLDEFTQREDRVAQAGLDAIMREYQDDLTRVPVTDQEIEDKKNAKKQRKKDEDERALESMELEEDKKDLINREIRIFRDAHKGEEEETSSRSDKERLDRRRRDDEMRDREMRERELRERELRERDRERERERDRDREREREREREKDRERAWGRSRGRSRSRSLERSRSRERTSERDADMEDEEDAYERRKLERKLREKELAYQELLKKWESRERKKAREYEKEEEREDEKAAEESKEARRLKEFLEDYDDERDDPKFYKGSALARRLKEREKEMELDDRDRQRERDELEEIRLRLTEEGHDDVEEQMARIERERDEHLLPCIAKSPELKHEEIEEPVVKEPPAPEPQRMSSPESDAASPVGMIPEAPSSHNTDSQSSVSQPPFTSHTNSSNDLMEHMPRAFNLASQLEASTESPLSSDATPVLNQPTSQSSSSKRKKLTVGDVFNQDDEADDGPRKRRLQRLDDEDDKPAPLLQLPQKPTTAEDKRKCIKNLIERIPTGKEQLFAYKLDWSMVDPSLMSKRIKPWVNKKIVEYIGEEEPTLSDFICHKVMEHSTPTNVLQDIAMVLDEEAEVFVVKMWRLLIYETEAKKLGLVK